MNEFERKRIALRMMRSILSVHRFYFNRGIRWAPDLAKTIERRRLKNKTIALIFHDRVVTQDVRGVQ